MVNQIVDRLHVSESNLAVLRYVRSRLSERGRSREQRTARRRIYRAALKRHKANVSLYVYVMRGCR
jgi:hypothetical protein